MVFKNFRIVQVITFALAFSLLIVSYSGVFISDTYKRDAASMAAQGMGQDAVNLFFVLPLLLLSLFLIRKEKKAAFFLYGGILIYLMYSFVIYCFGVYFNRLFLFYCLNLGLSVYGFVLFITELSHMEVQKWYNSGIPKRAVGIFLLLISVMFYLLWLGDVLPAIMSKTVPRTVSEYNLLVNPVHVLDMALILPGLIVIAILLFRNHHLVYLLAPIALVFIIIMAVALIGMVLALQMRGVEDNISIAVIFLLLAIISSLFLFLFLRKIKPDTGSTSEYQD